MNACILLAFALFAAGCAPKRPVLYPNDRLLEVGPELAEYDVERCIDLASEYVSPDETAQVAKGAAAGSAVGAATGAAVGAAVGNAGRGAAAGAAGGGTRAVMGGILRSRDPDPLVRRFVEQCLAERGYQIIGWR